MIIISSALSVITTSNKKNITKTVCSENVLKKDTAKTSFTF